MQTIEVIPHRVLKNSDTGQEISIFSALPPGNWESVTKGYSWEKIDHRGSVTRGLCRRPVATIEEANEVAIKYAEAIPNTKVVLMESRVMKCQVVPTEGGYQKTLEGEITHETKCYYTATVINQYGFTVTIKFSKSDMLRAGATKNDFPRYKLVLK